jgi:hypothetical protein
MSFPSYAKKYFWEIDTRKFNWRKNPEYTTVRILEYGDVKTIRWLFRNIDKETIKKVLLKRKGLSFKSRNFWFLFFNLPEKCLKKFYQKKQRNHWQY